MRTMPADASPRSSPRASGVIGPPTSSSTTARWISSVPRSTPCGRTSVGRERPSRPFVSQRVLRCRHASLQGPFRLPTRRRPARGDRPARRRHRRGDRFQTLLGITGSGKSATIAWLIEQVQRPTLVLAPNKALAAQLANEFRQFFPDNRVEYFVSYYDYYQPEAYIAQTDTYIEKESTVNDEIDRLRHAATAGAADPATT